MPDSVWSTKKDTEFKLKHKYEERNKILFEERILKGIQISI